MGYAIIVEACYGCRNVITFNPHKVPSLTVDGIRRPLCQDCFDHLNEYRIKHGIEAWPQPHPDAYQPISEYEL
jgi:hypothetical protein